MNYNIERRGRRSDPKPYGTLPVSPNSAYRLAYINCGYQIMKINPIASKESSQGWYSKSPLRSFGDSSETISRGGTPGANPRATQEQTKSRHVQRHQPLLPPSSPSTAPSSITPSPTVFGGSLFESPSSYSLPDNMMGQATPAAVHRSSPNFQLHSQDYPPGVALDGTRMLYPDPDVDPETQASPTDFWHCRDSGSREAAIAYSNLMHTDGLSLSTHVSNLQPGTHEHVTYQYSRAYPQELGVSAPYTPSGTVARSPPTAGQFIHDIHYPAMAAPSDYGLMPSAYKSHPSSMTLSGGNCTDPYVPMMDGMMFNVSSDTYFDFMALDHHDRHDRYGPHF